MRLRPHSADSTMLRLWPTGSSIGMAPVDYDPVVLLKPFGPHLTAGALPSRENRRCGSRSAYPFPGFRRCALVASPYLSSSALAGEALPPPSDIGPGPRAERDLNPPDASTVRHTLRGSPPLSGASVLSASRLAPLVPFPLASPARFSRSVQEPDRDSRCLHAGCRSVGIRTSTKLIPEDGSAPGFDIA